MKPFARSLAVCMIAALPLAACSTAQQNDAAPSTQETTATAEPSASTSTSEAAQEKPGVAEAREKFGSLAPESVFEDFESCKPAEVKNSMDCQGPKVGQFQFSKSEAKAASMTQLLTELRSARVVKDTGRAVIGWNTLGSTAVITVVDNDEGTVMQQMTSTDQMDPEERIAELKLVEAPAVKESEKEKSSETSTSEATSSESAAESSTEANA